MNAWVILVGGGYGAFLFNGTEEQAEEMRVHKHPLSYGLLIFRRGHITSDGL